jgi:hypothetical protein
VHGARGSSPRQRVSSAGPNGLGRRDGRRGARAFGAPIFLRSISTPAAHQRRGRKQLWPGLRFSDTGSHLIDSYLRRLKTGLETTAVLFVFMPPRREPWPSWFLRPAEMTSGAVFTSRNRLVFAKCSQGPPIGHPRMSRDARKLLKLRAASWERVTIQVMNRSDELEARQRLALASVAPRRGWSARASSNGGRR